MTQGFLLGAAILVEIPMSLVLLSRVLPYRSNRWANIVAGIIMTAVQLVSLLVRTPTLYYAFFSIIEITCTAVIVWYAWTWPSDESALSGQSKSLMLHTRDSVPTAAQISTVVGKNTSS